MAVRRRSSPPTRRPRGSAASYVRCAAGQCQNDASKSSLGHRVKYEAGIADGQPYPAKDYVVPVCPRCQVVARLITKTPLVPYTPTPISESATGGSNPKGENDMVMVGGKLRQRRQPRTVKVKVG